MIRRMQVLVVSVALATGAVATTAFADSGGRTFATKLIGYNETPLTINSIGRGDFTATVSKDGTSIQYRLSYSGLSAITQAHIHFGAPAITGQIVLFLCTNLTPPPSGVPLPQVCPPAPATITGTLTAADVIARPTQGIDGSAAGLTEMIKAMRAGAAYANVHTATFPTGEIRGAIRPGDDEDD